MSTYNAFVPFVTPGKIKGPRPQPETNYFPFRKWKQISGHFGVTIIVCQFVAGGSDDPATLFSITSFCAGAVEPESRLLDLTSRFDKLIVRGRRHED